MALIQCDVCFKDKEYISDTSNKKTKILHIPGYIDRRFNHHIHICKKCFKKHKLNYIDIERRADKNLIRSNVNV